jgi:hypothetical protein
MPGLNREASCTWPVLFIYLAGKQYLVVKYYLAGEYYLAEKILFRDKNFGKNIFGGKQKLSRKLSILAGRHYLAGN